jgi:hypothetical protein
MGRTALVVACFAVLVAVTGCRSARPHGSPTHHEATHEHGFAPDLDAPHDHGPEGHLHAEPLYGRLCYAWGACPEHAHASRCGAAYVHAFGVEPAFLGRDLLLTVEGEDGETSLEAEVEYALTRRLLMVVELPWHWTDEEDGGGDVGVGLRGLLYESNRFLASAQVAVEAPTARGDLGADEWRLAPSVLAWGDLGRGFTLQGGLTLDLSLEGGDTEGRWDAALAWSLPRSPFFGGCGGHGPAHASLLLEGHGLYALDGAERGTLEHGLLLGVSLPLHRTFDLRAGWTVAWEEGEDAATGWVLGCVVHL